jgi:outer membrane protein assembly factor BamD
MPKKFLAPAALAAALAFMASCSAPPPPTEDTLIIAGSNYFEDENYIQAIQSYSELLEQFPFSEESERASLNVAHAYYLTRQYEQAIAAFEEFERLYPTSPLLPFVEYTVGMCHLDRSLSGDRDKSASDSALRQFERLIDRFPDSVYTPIAKLRAADAQENLAGHELVIGDWYRLEGKENAAEARYAHILKVYPESEAAALVRLRNSTEPSPLTVLPGDSEQVALEDLPAL